ncbi:MAG TPA: hypothetical protein VN042_03220, partial [Asticcacaulis sp.]|nr:hypothetical protein [Asticcacaulis sp.]
PDYCVIEEIPPKMENINDGKSHEMFDFATMRWTDLNNYDDREETLTVDTSSLRVHRVKEIQICTEDFEVTRHRWTKTTTPF